MKISVIMTTYNRPDALKAVLEAMECQKGIDPADWELLIADDGSAEATRSLIEQFSSNSPLHIEHVWHEDKGFRAAEIRNRAAVRARGDYLVFLDGDWQISGRKPDLAVEKLYRHASGIDQSD